MRIVIILVIVWFMSSDDLVIQSDISPHFQQQVGEFYQQHHGWLYGWLYKKLGCEHQAQDLSHDAFIKLLKKQYLPKLREPRAYLTTIANGLVVNYWRRRDLERAYLDALANEPEAETLTLESRALIIETLMKIDSVLRGLPKLVREAFLLSQLEGLTYKVIAERLKVSERTIKKYMARAMLHCLLVAEADKE